MQTGVGSQLPDDEFRPGLFLRPLLEHGLGPLDAPGSPGAPWGDPGDSQWTLPLSVTLARTWKHVAKSSKWNEVGRRLAVWADNLSESIPEGLGNLWKASRPPNFTKNAAK